MRNGWKVHHVETFLYYVYYGLPYLPVQDLDNETIQRIQKETSQKKE